MIEVKRYDPSQKKQWEDFITKSRLDSFLLYRDFMDYHSDRFTDCSLMVYRKGKLDAVMPGNLDQDIFYSHQGLTYGGIILSQNTGSSDLLSYFVAINNLLKTLGTSNVIYKEIPFIYRKLPSQESSYALFKLNAEKIGCNLSSTIDQKNKLAFSESRKSGLRKAIKANIEIRQPSDFIDFWMVLEENLMKTHNKIPVHSLEEITMLREKFPENILNYNCVNEVETIAGCVLFVMKNVVHVQYISANETGKNSGALDLLFDYLINEKYAHVPYFDFGQSTEQMGAVLNENLIFQKEGFGGRGVTYDVYKYALD